jgi:hypothetical protein
MLLTIEKTCSGRWMNPCIYLVCDKFVYFEVDKKLELIFLTGFSMSSYMITNPATGGLLCTIKHPYVFYFATEFGSLDGMPW